MAGIDVGNLASKAVVAGATGGAGAAAANGAVAGGAAAEATSAAGASGGSAAVGEQTAKQGLSNIEDGGGKSLSDVILETAVVSVVSNAISGAMSGE